MGEGASGGAGRVGEVEWPIFNTHVHLPPGFPAFDSVEDAVTTAARQEVRILRAPNLVAADRHLWESNQQGYVDGQGRLNPGFRDGVSLTRWFAELGATLIDSASMAPAR